MYIAQLESIASKGSAQSANVARVRMDVSHHRGLMVHLALSQRRSVEFVFQGIVFNS